METAVKTKTTEEVVREMLTENTGSHFLDSGGAYGRNWSRNANKNFDDEPTQSCTWSVYSNKPEISATVSLYKWMLEHLKFDPEMQERFDEYAQEHEDDCYLELQEGFAEQEHSRVEQTVAPNTVNTYNFDNDLSQVIQYVELFLDGDYEPSHLVVSVHGGCDVRGGYTAPKCFSLREEYYDLQDRMSIKTLCAGDWCWSYSGYWRYAETECPDIPDILKLKCYEVDDIEDEGLKQFLALIARAPQGKENIALTTLGPLQRLNAIDQINETVKELEEEILRRAVEVLDEMPEYCTLVHNKKMYLIYGGEALEVTV